MEAPREPRRLELEVRFDAQPIEGRLYARDGDGAVDRPFSGWLGLIAAIDAAAGRAAASPRQREDGR